MCRWTEGPVQALIRASARGREDSAGRRGDSGAIPVWRMQGHVLLLTIHPAARLWLETFVTMLLLVDLSRTHNRGQAAHGVFSGRV